MCACHGISHVGKFKPLVCMIAMKGNFASRQHSFFSLPHLRTFTWSEELKAESNHQLLGQRLREFLSLSWMSASPLLLAAAEVPFLLKLFHLPLQESSSCFMETCHYTSVPSTIALDECHSEVLNRGGIVFLGGMCQGGEEKEARGLSPWVKFPEKGIHVYPMKWLIIRMNCRLWGNMLLLSYSPPKWVTLSLLGPPLFMKAKS